MYCKTFIIVLDPYLWYSHIYSDFHLVFYVSAQVSKKGG